MLTLLAAREEQNKYQLGLLAWLVAMRWVHGLWLWRDRHPFDGLYYAIDVHAS
jgi:hypothetical protein